MPESPEKFFVTTPIYYVNARPHIGHAYTTIVADVLARRHRLLGHDTLFLTGTDEHGQKIERSAITAGIPPQAFADQVSRTFRDLWVRMGILDDTLSRNDPLLHRDFIRTTDPRHTRGVQHLFRELQRRGAIYKSTYTGQYCVSDEAYVDGPPGIRCPDCGRLTETVSEENYYFKLSAFQLPLLDLIESNTLRITPDSRRNEVLSFLRGEVNALLAEVRDRTMVESSQASPSSQAVPFTVDTAALSKLESQGKVRKTEAGTYYLPGALKDLSISRTSFTWGVPVPDDPAHVVYVWLDALANYMTAVGYGSDTPADQALVQKFWPADLHLVGKEIIRFHCVYWPAFLLAADLPLPEAVAAHGWLLFEESKMSKSRGNIVRTETILDAFGTHYRNELVRLGQPEPSTQDADLFATDVLRYFLLREIPFGQDGSFSFDALITRYNADLANGYGNLVSRVLKLIQNSCSAAIPGHHPWTHTVINIVSKLPRIGGFSVGLPTGDLVRVPDVELARLAAMVCKFYPAAFKAMRFSLNVDFSELQADLLAYRDVTPLDRGVLDYTLLLLDQTDRFISSRQPWNLAKNTSDTDKADLADTLYTAAESIRILTALLYPILPFSTARVWAQLGLGNIEDAARRGDLKNLQWGGLQPGTKLGPLAPIFPRAEKGLAQIMTDVEATKTPPPSDPDTPPAPGSSPQPPSAQPVTHTSRPAPSRLSNETTSAAPSDPADSTHPGAPPRVSALPHHDPIAQVAGSSAPIPDLARTPSHTEARPSGLFSGAASAPPIPQPASIPGEPTGAGFAPFAPQITIDDFSKVDLRAARILVAERIPKADKLLRLEVDLGSEQRQILSGIAEWYTPEELVGRRIVVIANLAPRTMRGLVSHGMLLAASHGEGGKPILATFPETDDLPPGARLK